MFAFLSNPRSWIAHALLLGSSLHAHQVPNLTIEAEFRADGTGEIRVNFDPRLFLAGDPRTLPPIPAEWYLEQAEGEQGETLSQATAYVLEALDLQFGGLETHDPTWTCQPIDGATGKEMAEDTAEMHFLASGELTLPEGAADFVLHIRGEAKAPVVLLNSLAGKAARRVQVLYPGEASRPFECRVTEEE